MASNVMSSNQHQPTPRPPSNFPRQRSRKLNNLRRELLSQSLKPHLIITILPGLAITDWMLSVADMKAQNVRSLITIRSKPLSNDLRYALSCEAGITREKIMWLESAPAAVGVDDMVRYFERACAFIDDVAPKRLRRKGAHHLGYVERKGTMLGLFTRVSLRSGGLLIVSRGR